MLKKPISTIRKEFNENGSLPDDTAIEIIEEVSRLSNLLDGEKDKAKAAIKNIQDQVNTTMVEIQKDFQEKFDQDLAVAKNKAHEDAIRFTKERDEAKKELKAKNNIIKKLQVDLQTLKKERGSDVTV